MSARPLHAACVQMRASEDPMENIADASRLIREAAAQGATFIVTPENTNLMAADARSKLQRSFVEDDDPAVPAFARLAGELGVFLLIGSLAIKVSETKTANRSYLFDTEGKLRARYDKIHLYDVDLPSGESYRESNTVAPGAQAIGVNLPFGKLGMTVCYDMRFPRVYSSLAKSGAEILAVPSAFTETTGKAHWHVLLRARAIETGAFVIAPAQGGLHANGRKTYGHSLIIGPWGDVRAEGGTDPSVVSAEIDLNDVADVRARIPSLDHERPFTPPVWY